MNAKVKGGYKQLNRTSGVNKKLGAGNKNLTRDIIFHRRRLSETRNTI